MKIQDINNNLYTKIFALYVGSGPVYWIPGVPVDIINIIKVILFFVIVLWPIFHITLHKLIFPGGKVVFLLYLTFFFLSIPSMLQGVEEDSLYKLQNISQIFLFLISCGYLIRKNLIQSVAYLAVRIFVFFSIFSLVLMLIIPNHISPLNEGLVLSQTGLGGSRTGWSPAIALYLPWLYSGFVVLPSYWVWIAALVMVANEVLVAGRTGMVASLIPFLFYGLYRRSVKIFLMITTILFIVGVLAINNLEMLRFDTGGFSDVDSMNELSNDRIYLYIQSLYEIIANPFIGVGVGVGELSATHNVLLRSAVEGGIPYVLSIIGLFLIAFYRGWKGMAQKDWFVLSAFMTVLSGIVNSLFEPVGMFGSFNNSSIWWLCFAICVSAKQSKTYRQINSIR